MKIVRNGPVPKDSKWRGECTLCHAVTEVGLREIPSICGKCKHPISLWVRSQNDQLIKYPDNYPLEDGVLDYAALWRYFGLDNTSREVVTDSIVKDLELLSTN